MAKNAAHRRRAPKRQAERRAPKSTLLHRVRNLEHASQLQKDVNRVHELRTTSLDHRADALGDRQQALEKDVSSAIATVIETLERAERAIESVQQENAALRNHVANLQSRLASLEGASSETKAAPPNTL